MVLGLVIGSMVLRSSSGHTFAEFVLKPGEACLEDSSVPFGRAGCEQNKFLANFVDRTYDGIRPKPCSYRQNYRFNSKSSSVIVGAFQK
jgi:hypothetical protein